MAGRLYRMAKVVSANPKSWGIVDANEISGFKRVAKLSDLYSIAECILSSSYGDGVTDGADAVGQIWHVSETNGDYKLTNWADRKSAAGWTKLSFGNLDTTLFEVVSELPSTIATIKKHIYLKAAGTTGDKNNYAEYIYTGDLTATYDATKWEKLGDVTASVDLSGYYTKIDADKKIASEINKHRINNIGFVPATDGTSDLQLKLTEYQGEKVGPTTIPTVTTNTNGLMSPTMFGRLNSALTEAPSFELATSGNESLLNIEATYNKKTYTVSLPNAGEGGVGLMTPDMYTKLEDTSNNLSTLTTKVNDLTENVNGIKSFSVNNVVDGEQYSLMATDGTDAFNVGNIFIRTAGNGNTEIEAGGKKTDINAIAAYARYDINGNHIDATYLKKADLVAISNDELTNILI